MFFCPFLSLSLQRTSKITPMRKKKEEKDTHESESKRVKRWITKADDVTSGLSLIQNKITFDVREWRILAWIMAKMQMKLGDRLDLHDKKNMAPMYESLKSVLFYGENTIAVQVTMPLNFILAKRERGDATESLQMAKDTFKSLHDKGIDYIDWDALKKTYNDNKAHTIGACIPVVLSYEFKEVGKKTYVDFLIHEKFWNAILDFSKGFRTFEITTLLSLRNVSSIKFYTLNSHQKKPMVYSVAWLRKWLNCVNIYTDDKDFIKRMVKAAKTELDKKSPFTFDFVQLGEQVSPYEGNAHPENYVLFDGNYFKKAGKGRGAKTINIGFTPIYQEGKNKVIDERMSVFLKDNYKFADLSDEELNELRFSFGFDDKTINQYLITIAKCKHIFNGICNPDWRTGHNFIDFLSRVKDSMLRKHGRDANSVGYLVASMKKHIQESEKQEL